MVDKRRANPLKVRRGGRYLELNRSSPSKKKSSCGVAAANAGSFKGVRMRVWGKWVTEIRDPVTKTRIWLGSFATAEMAARAYDAAVVCLKGASAPEVNFPDSIPSFVTSQGYSSPKEIQAVALAAATASVPAAAPLAMAAAELTNPREECEAPLEVTDREFHRAGDGDETGDNWANCPLPESECPSSNVEDWILNEFEEKDASLDNPDALEAPLRRQFSDPVEQIFRPWPISSDDFDDASDCWRICHDAHLWSFA